MPFNKIKVRNFLHTFDNQRLQVSSHLNTLFSVESIGQESGAALKEL